MSVYVLTQNGVVQKYPYTLTDLILDNPETSFPNPMTDEIAADFNTYPVVETPQPSYDPITENLDWVNPMLENGVWVQQWSVSAATPEEIEKRGIQAKQTNKAQASQLLSETDWVDLGPVGDPAVVPHLANVAEFNSYRLALRAIAVNPPITVDPWPIKPEELWVTE